MAGGRRDPPLPAGSETPAVDEAVWRAAAYLRAQARAGFPEACHEMTFPRWAGFRVRMERQRGDGFARAVLGGLMLDIAALSDPGDAAVWRELAGREADYVAAARLRDREGGWSYFPGLPELPPDVDSLAAVLHLFARIAPRHLPLCEDPVRWALEEQAADGSFSTWILAPTNSPGAHRVMKRGIRKFWGPAVDVEVCARFLLGLHTWDGRRFEAAVGRGLSFIEGQQTPEGWWEPTWYWGPLYGTGLCLDLLRQCRGEGPATARAAAAIGRLQRADGGWGRWESTPLETALGLWLLMPAESSAWPPRLRSGLRLLLEQHAGNGTWGATPWIKMDVGRAAGRVTRTLTYQSTPLTTAFVLRTLLAAQRRGGDRRAS